MVDTTKILGELLGGRRGGGGLASGGGAKMLEDLLGVGQPNQGSSNQQSNTGGGIFGGDQSSGGNIFGGGSQPTNPNAGGGVFGGGDKPRGGGGGLGGGLGDLLGKALQELGKGRGGISGGGNAGSNNPFEQLPQQAPLDQAGQSEVYIRAMIQSAMADGQLDQNEQQAIVDKIGNMGKAEADFVRAEMAKGSNVQQFIQTVPRGIEEEVYSVSLMAVQLDNQREAQHLHALAQGLRITQEQSNAIHDRLGASRLYT